MPSVSDSSKPWFSAEDDFKEKYGFRNNQKNCRVCSWCGVVERNYYYVCCHPYCDAGDGFRVTMRDVCNLFHDCRKRRPKLKDHGRGSDNRSKNAISKNG